MTSAPGACPPWLDADLAGYARALATVLDILERLADVARGGRDAANRNDSDRLAEVSRERGGIAAEITALQPVLEAARLRIVEHVALARESARFSEVESLHRQGERLLDAILALDRDTLSSLDVAGRHRRDVALALEAGEATLAAYRRVVAPPPLSAGLVDQRG